MRSSNIKYLLQRGCASCKYNVIVRHCIPRISCSRIANGLCYDGQIRSTRMAHLMTQADWVSSRDETREMMKLWPDIITDLTEAYAAIDLSEAAKWMSKVLQFNVPYGKKHRALALVYTFCKLARPEDLTVENLRLARILGWCIELLQASFLVGDDIMDNSEKRRGQPCWYLQDNVGLGAINDTIILEQTAYELLRRHFKNKQYYLNILDTVNEIAMKTAMGQTLDLLSTKSDDRLNLNLFTMDRYNAIVKYKTAYYSFVLPVVLAMYLTGVTDPEIHRQAETILLEMGRFFQVQDDYLDCYGDPSVTGKIGRDIPEGKCSWPAVIALQHVTPAQRRVFTECYGCEDLEKVARIEQLYNDLGLPAIYATYEEESYHLLTNHIRQIPRGLPQELFSKFLAKIYRREA